MEQSKFIEILKTRKIEYEIKGNVISIIGDKYDEVDLTLLKSLPKNKNIQFSNKRNIYLNSLKSMPENVQFNNGGHVDLNSLESMPKNTQFNNGGFVYLFSLIFLPENFQFNNGGDVVSDSLMFLPENTQFNNGGSVTLRSLESLPENVQFNNGGKIYLKFRSLEIKKSYVERNRLKIKDGKVILYKRVSKDFLTQEGADWETRWEIGSIVTHPNWDPTKDECGAGKFHACAKPFWCDYFRHNKDDRYIAIEVNVKDLYEWKIYPIFRQKISFREGKVLYECDRLGHRMYRL